MKNMISISFVVFGLLFHLPVLAQEINIEVNRVYANKYGEPQALVTVTNNLNEGLYFVEVKCTWLNGSSPVAIDKRIYQNIDKGESDSVRFWVKEEELIYDSVKCKVSDGQTSKAYEKLLDRYEDATGHRPN